MLSVKELLQLMETQQKDHQQEITLDQHRDQIEHKAELETEIVNINRRLSVVKKNIDHYTRFASQLLHDNPSAFGQPIVTLLENIVQARVLQEHPELFSEVEQLQTRTEEIKKEISK